MSHQKQLLGPRSSLVSHAFPQFYACYLLKSIQTPKAQTVYIGSTPNPPRRIRQHNGELTQGAWKTRLRRPWVMHLIVHGFPSRLAALQFEWAWQHPHLSRHLREPDGTQTFPVQRLRRIKNSVQVLRSMITSHTYRTWPLHVKLFTAEAVTFWKESAPSSKQLPPGFTCSVELEGVDGKSGRKGSGRTGAINVKDEEFTSSYLAKNSSLLARNRPLVCTICQQPLKNYTTDVLTTTLCPSPTCVAVSHLSCLSKHFLHSDPTNSGLIPRGGVCTSCKTYVLWGDVIRGCFRRKVGRVPPEEEDSAESDIGEQTEEENTRPESKSPARKTSKRKQKEQTICGSQQGLSGSTVILLDECSIKDPKRNRSPIGSAHSESGSVIRRRRKADIAVKAEDGDFVVLEAGELAHVHRKRGRPRKASRFARRKGAPDEELQLEAEIAETAGELRKKRGRPQKAVQPFPAYTLTTPSAVNPLSRKRRPSISKAQRPNNVSDEHLSSADVSLDGTSSEGSDITPSMLSKPSTVINETAGLLKPSRKKRGRRPKNVAAKSYSTSALTADSSVEFGRDLTIDASPQKTRPLITHLSSGLDGQVVTLERTFASMSITSPAQFAPNFIEISD